MFKFIFLVILIVLSFSLKAQTNNEMLSAQLDSFIQDQIIQESIPGISACIVKNDTVVYKSAFGLANISENIPVTLNTKFTLASISKLFVATACAQLWQTGSLDIDENINTYLPFPIVNPNFPNEAITIRQLLHHKSGLHDSESDLQLWVVQGNPSISLAEFCESYFIVEGSLFQSSNWGNTAPGLSDYWYSNAGFTLLGYIVEVVSGLPFNQYCEENIFNPLQMNNATWFYTNTDTTNIAMPYNSYFQPYGYYSVPEYPAAMLKCSVEELANFLIAYTQKGSFQSFHLVNDTIFESIVPSSMTNGFGWWGMDTWYGNQNGNFWSHGGFMNGVRTQLNYYPADSSGLIILTNGESDYWAIQNKLQSYIPLFTTGGLSDVYEVSEFKVNISPNPVSINDNLIIMRDNNINLKLMVNIYNTNGNNLYSCETNEPTLLVKLNNFSKGLYYITLTENGRTIIKKIVVL